MLILQYALAALSAIQTLSQAGQSIDAILTTSQSVLSKAQAENRDPTAEERQALDDLIAKEMAVLDQAK